MSDLVERLHKFECSDAVGDGDFSVCLEAAAEIKRLRKIIADAPHEEDCGYWSVFADAKCDCWKAQALREEGSDDD